MALAGVFLSVATGLAQHARVSKFDDTKPITLTGVVNSNVERMLARSLATTFGAFSVKNELKTDAEMKLLAEKL